MMRLLKSEPAMKERLQKIMARAGIASRRASEKLILLGQVRVNGKVITQLGTMADPELDEIRVDGKRISVEANQVYIMLHKPEGYVTTLHDPQGRPIVTNLLPEMSERIFPVGRLDYDSEGLLLLTNDGAFTQRILHPHFEIPRTYRVKIVGHLTSEQWRILEKGFQLPDGPFSPVSVKLEKSNRLTSWMNIVLLQGRTREIRRAFDSLGHSVSRLIRTAYGNLDLGGLKKGLWRYLTDAEVRDLLMMSNKENRLIITRVRRSIKVK